MVVNFQNTKAGPQQSYAASGGNSTYQAFSAALTHNPRIIIFDNQGNVPITISDDGTTDFKTFAAGEALVLDLVTNRSLQNSTFYWPVGTQFYAKSTAGTGSFYISYVYAK